MGTVCAHAVLFIQHWVSLYSDMFLLNVFPLIFNYFQFDGNLTWWLVVGVNPQGYTDFSLKFKVLFVL